MENENSILYADRKGRIENREEIFSPGIGTRSKKRQYEERCDDKTFH